MFEQMFNLDGEGKAFAKMVDAAMRMFDKSLDAKAARAMGIAMAKEFTNTVNANKGEANNFPTVFAGITLAIASIYGECIRKMKLDEQQASAVGCTVAIMLSQYLMQTVDNLYSTSKDTTPLDSATIVSEVEALLGISHKEDDAG